MTATPKIHRPTATTLLALAALAVIAAGCGKTAVRKDAAPVADTVQTAAAAATLDTVSGTFTDSRDGQVYRTVVIGQQRWMAQNLNYDVPGVDTDVCYDNDPANCDLYGRLYDWSTVMDISASYNNSTWEGSDVNHRGICPVGWHVPSHDEWWALTDAVGDWEIAGTRLKSTSGWSGGGNGTDDHGFSALPGGLWWSGRFYGVGDGGRWWSATEYDATRAWRREMDTDYNVSGVGWGNYVKVYRFSLRCVRDFAAPQ